MTMELFQKIVGDYTEIGGGPISLTPVVGEVFLDKLLVERLLLLEEARAITSVSATTNGIMVRRFDDDRLRELLGHFDRLKVSVYGLDREEYLAMTRRDEYDEFRDNLVRMLSLARPGSVVFGIRWLRSRTEDEVLAWTDDVAHEAGLESVDISSSTGAFANWSFFDTSKPLPMAGEWLPVRRNARQCGIPLLGAEILVDGRVSFCACANFDGTPDLILGDLKERSLAELLDSETASRLWDWQANGVPEFCKTCSFHTPLEDVARHEWVYRDPIRYIGG
jgi:radical SAM protein with 4Fe4S-binding SPASM domain